MLHAGPARPWAGPSLDPPIPLTSQSVIFGRLKLVRPWPSAFTPFSLYHILTGEYHVGQFVKVYLVLTTVVLSVEFLSQDVHMVHNNRRL